MSSNTEPLNFPALIKAVAAQLIVWHHLALYGPMSDVVQPHAETLLGALEEHGRLAVQAFLVVGGFLAARGLRLDSRPSLVGSPWQLLARRYTRLALPYVVVLPMALGAAALARSLIDHPTIPEPATVTHLLAHLLLLQDILDIDALSAGVWYLAIDFQLYLMLVLLVRLGGQQAMLLCMAVMGLSLFWLNRDATFDIWGIYFFGAYGLGILAYWTARQSSREQGMLLIGLVVGVALLVAWRERIAVAGAVALLLAFSRGQLAWRSKMEALVSYLDQRSYPLFLVHYPVCLAFGALVYWRWPGSVEVNAIGMVVAWLACLAAAEGLYRVTAAPVWRRRGAAVGLQG